MDATLKLLQRVLRHHNDSGVSDAELLGRYLRVRDQAAFELLVWRYHRMVLGVCRRVLADSADVEDAFQATFMVLARRADSIRRRASVTSWLYGVARRVALEAAGRTARRQRRQSPLVEVAAGEDPGEVADREEMRRLVDEELGRLPEKYRLPLVLCHLEGATYDEAAQRLGYPKGTVSTRLTRARELLRSRLVRRGVTLSAGGLAGWLTPEAPAALVATVRSTATPTSPGAGASLLADKVLRAMTMTRVKIAATLVLAVTAFAGAGGRLAYRAAASADPPPGAAADAKPPKDDRQAIQGSWLMESMLRDDRRVSEKELDGLGWVIKDGRMTIRHGRGHGTDFTYTLDSTAQPKTIDFVRAMQKQPAVKSPTSNMPASMMFGIYRLEGDRLTVAYSLFGRPTDWTAGKGSQRYVVTFRRGPLPELSESDKAQDAEYERLAGTWEQVSLVDDGQSVASPAASRPRLHIVKDGSYTVRVQALRLGAVVDSAFTTVDGVGRFVFDPAARPKRLAVLRGPTVPRIVLGVVQYKPWQGVYELDGDVLRMCLAPPGKDRAEKLESKVGSGLSLEVWKRVRD